MLRSPVNEKTDDLCNNELLQQLPATQSSAGCDRRELPASDVQQRCPLAQHKKKTRSCLGLMYVILHEVERSGKIT